MNPELLTMLGGIARAQAAVLLTAVDMAARFAILTARESEALAEALANAADPTDAMPVARRDSLLGAVLDSWREYARQVAILPQHSTYTFLAQLHRIRAGRLRPGGHKVSPDLY